MGLYLFLIIVCSFSAFLQSSIGFGAAVVMVNVLPFVLPPSKAIIISQSACIFLNLYILLRTYKHVRWHILVPLLIPSLICSAIVTRLSLNIEVKFMMIFLGILFILLAIYFSFIASRIKIKPTKISAFIIGTISGTMNGMFGSGGPPAILYLAPALDDKKEYLATSQIFFLGTNLISFIIRVIYGNIIPQDVPGIVIGIISGLLGAFVGMKFTDKINGTLLKRFVYFFIGINGLVIILNQLV